MPKKGVAQDRYPPIADYALIGDCHAAALVSRTGSIDWCCMPRFDSGSVFGRLLDWDRGGHCAIAPRSAGTASFRSYVEDTLVLVTTFRDRGGEAHLIDCFTMRRGGSQAPYRQLIRVVEGVRGRMNLDLVVSPRFDYGEVRPWIRQHGVRLYSAIGGNDALVVTGDPELTPTDDHDLTARISIRAGERSRLSIQYMRPDLLDSTEVSGPTPEEIDRRLEQTIAWWRRWVSKVRIEGPHASEVKRSAIVLKCLTNAPTGAIVAAPTTSLPEVPGGSRNWDYRYSWIRDSAFTVGPLAGRRLLAVPGRARRVRGHPLARARLRDLGDPRPAQALRPFQGHVLVGLGARPEACTGKLPAGPRAEMADRPERASPGHRVQGLRQETRDLRPVVR